MLLTSSSFISSTREDWRLCISSSFSAARRHRRECISSAAARPSACSTFSSRDCSEASSSRVFASWRSHVAWLSDSRLMLSPNWCSCTHEHPQQGEGDSDEKNWTQR
eukprot:GHVT01053230.1.p1 GENE.GHVT01053230.1~~GHVT01053230.1.p1  ORF type:complete len:107 (+),score=24.71 GHVT01053230.1:603-923(+)